MLWNSRFYAVLATMITTHSFGATRDGALDTTYVPGGSGYSNHQGYGLAPIFSSDANKDAVAVAKAFLIKSDQSALIVGTALNTINSSNRYGIGVVGLDRYGDDAYQPQCTSPFHDCDAAGVALGLNDSYSYKIVNAWLPNGDSGTIVAVGSLTDVANALFVAEISNAAATNNSSILITTDDFADTHYSSYVATSAVQTSPTTIYIAGYAVFSGQDTDFFVARLDGTSEWQVDTTFGLHGIAEIYFDLGGNNGDAANAIAVGPDGKITLVGTVSTSASNAKVGIVRLNANGTPDTTFGAGTGKTTFDFFGSAYTDKRSFGYTVALRDDGSMIIGGAAYRPAQGAFTAEQFAAVARLKNDGTIDSSSVFGAASSATDNATVSNNGAAVLFHYFEAAEILSDVRAVTIQPNGRILLAGTATDGEFSFFGMNRLQKNGNPDATFSSLPNSGYKDSTETYSFQNGLNSYTIPFGATQSNQDFATGIVSRPEGIYVYGTSTAPTTNNQDFGYIRLSNSDAIFANNFSSLPPGG